VNAVPDKQDYWIAGALWVGTTGLLLLTSQMGVPRDESFYFHAAHEYIGWFEQLWMNIREGQPLEAFEKASIDDHWAYNGEHPVLAKTLFALSHKLFGELLGWLSPMNAMRLPGMGFGALAVSLTYLFGAKVFGRLAGFAAAGCLLFQPRYFFHAHLACFDVPITALWVAVVYAYWRSLEEKPSWAVVTGLLWGLALSTKLNAFFLPVVLVGHWLVIHWREFSWRPTESVTQFEMPRIPLAFWSMLIIGPLVFFLLWPRLWHEPVEHFRWYVNFHLDHTHYFVQYFHRDLIYPPFPIEFPWVMTLVTVPGTILLAFVAGLLGLWPQGRAWLDRWAQAISEWSLPERYPDAKGTHALIVINLIFPIALISMPDTPIFGGTKHWMPAMPFMAIIAGFGVQYVSRVIADWLSIRRAAFVGSAMAMLAALGPAVYATAHNHPFGTSYYSEVIGGQRGAADAGMMRQYWGYTSKQALPWLNQQVEEETKIWTHNTTGYAWDAYEANELVTKDFYPVGIEQSDYGLYHHQRAFNKELTDLWREYNTFTPSYVVHQDGVPLLSLYRRHSGDT
jgi:4-amino-4-deoxy-L-arabinose transferase-like glycosyltransferase